MPGEIDSPSARSGERSVSVVVPTRNSGTTLRSCLESIVAQSIRCELIVVDNGSEDNTLEIANDLADIVITAGPERSAQRNIGCAASSGQIVGFVDSDMVLEPTVAQEARAALVDGTIAVVVPEYTTGNGYWAEVRAYERSLYIDNDDVEAARFFVRTFVDQVGGFNEQLTGGEDWDLDIRIRKLGKVGRTTAQIEHKEGRVHFLDACRKKGYYAAGYQGFARQHGTSTLIQIALNRPYVKSPKLLFSKHGAGLAMLKLGEAISMSLSISRAYGSKRLHQLTK